MIRHVLAGIAAVLTIGAMVYVWRVDVEVHTMDKVAEIFKKSELQVELENQNRDILQNKQSDLEKEKENDEVNAKLKALREKAGNVSGFTVSKLYKTKCASCHGAGGEGGVGPKVIGQSYEKLSQALIDFKDGSKKNYVMYGLLQKMTTEQLDSLAKEISLFASKAK